MSAQDLEEIRNGFSDIDRRSTRPLRRIVQAMLAGQEPPAEDVAVLSNLEARAEVLRARLAQIQGPETDPQD